MITKVQGYVTWGEADPAAVGRLLEARGETADGRRLTSEALAPVGKDLATLTKEVMDRGLPTVAPLKPLLRLTPPRGGWRSTKKPFARGGALGYRGAKINELVERML
jgi:large subunit ribosomal protein L30